MMQTEDMNAVDQAHPQPATPPAATAASAPIILPIRQIRRDGGTQARAQLDEATVADYAEAMQAGATFPPVRTSFDGSAYWLTDGVHRIAAAERIGRTTIAVEVEQGTRRDAVLAACGANAVHGLRRSADDKERAVRTLLEDAEWGQWSYREIVRRCRVSHDFVRTVAERRGLTGRASSQKTFTTRHGTTATINTTKIAAANAARAKEPANEPQPGAIHPLIAAAKEPEPAHPTGIDWPQRFIQEPPALPVPPALLLTGWQITPPSQHLAFYVARNQRVPVSTHGFATLEEAIDAAQREQGRIEDIEALDWTIERDAADPQLLVATHPARERIGPVRSLYALHQQIVGGTTTTPEIGTWTTTVTDTDLGERVQALSAAGYEWKGASSTPDGWRHLVVRADAPDMVRQRLTVVGIDRLLELHTPPATGATGATSAERTPTTGPQAMLVPQVQTSTATPQAALVPHVLIIAGQPNPYQLPDREIVEVLGHTAEMVSCRYPDGRTVKRRQERVYCLPNPEAAQHVDAAFIRYQDTLSAIAEELRALRTYPARLAEAGGIEAAPNPLTPSVIAAPEPDGYHASSFDYALQVPRAERYRVRNYTARMFYLEGHAATITGQQGISCVPTMPPGSGWSSAAPPRPRPTPRCWPC